MRFLASIIPLLLLLGGVRAGDGPAYNDTCFYSGKEAMCGDQCMYKIRSCYCRYDTDYSRPYSTDYHWHCCLEPGETCTGSDG